MRLLIASLSLVLCACQLGHSNASVDSFVDPSYSSQNLKRVVVLPMTNAGITAGQAQELTRAFAQALKRRSPQLEIIGAGEAVEKINAAGLADEWSAFLRNYNTSGIPNTAVAKRFGAVLGVDAIVQGSILRLTQKDSSGFDYPSTRVSIRYGAIGSKTGTMLWEITAEGVIMPHSYTAVPVIDAARIANDKVIGSIPE